MTPTPNTLFRLEGQLFELLEAREEAVRRSVDAHSADDPACSADTLSADTELNAIETGIQQFIATQLREVDGLRAPLKALEQAVALNKSNAAAATNRAMVLQNRHNALKDVIKMCMVALDQAGEWKPKQTRKFESARGSFTLRGNGGAQPVEITDESLVPDEYKRVSVTMSLDLWMQYGTAAFSGLDVRVTAPEVSRSAIAEALAKPCGHCNGAPAVGSKDECQHCGGSGTAGVPGARLAPRSESLVIK